MLLLALEMWSKWNDSSASG